MFNQHYTEHICVCPEGYTDIGSGNCQIVQETVATIPDPCLSPLIAENYETYTILGTIIYSSYNSDGTGVIETIIPPTNHYWNNWNSSDTAGVLNRCAVWNSGTIGIGEQIEFSSSIEIETAGTYYIGVGCDNEAGININGTNIIHQNDLTMSYFLEGDYEHQPVTYRYWHIYPIQLQKGTNIITVYGTNTTQAIAAIGVQIYDATLSELTSATFGTLDDNIIFDTSDLVGSCYYINSDGNGCSCPSGYDMVNDGGVYKCIQVTTIECE